MNNITVDGSAFNNSFGLGGQPGGRTGVAPISLEAIEQVQVNVAPFDVRQGSFVGAGVNTVTRSGTNQFTGAFYHRFRNQDWVGTDAKGQTVNPGTFNFRNTGGWGGGPICKNKLFAFGNYEDEMDTRRCTTFRANTGGEAVGRQHHPRPGVGPRHAQQLPEDNFNYDTGRLQRHPDRDAGQAIHDPRATTTSTTATRSASATTTSTRSPTAACRARPLPAAAARPTARTFLTFQNSNYALLENIRSGVGEWNSVIGNSMANNADRGYTTQDESRDDRGTTVPVRRHPRRAARPTRRSAPSRSRRTTSCATRRSSPGQLHEVRHASTR